MSDPTPAELRTAELDAIRARNAAENAPRRAFIENRHHCTEPPPAALANTRDKAYEYRGTGEDSRNPPEPEED